jgi:hypothetical protein
MFKFSLLATVILLCSQVHAKRFANGYTEFELPPGWQCVIEGSEWVCQSEDKDRKKEAIIILAAKKRGSQDNLANYQKYLNQSKNYQLPGAKMQRSEPKSVKVQNLNGQSWVDALHLASEVPGFYTRYLATVKADIGVAITFSVTKSMYNAYKGIFDNVIASMRIFRQTNLKANSLANGKNTNEDFNDTTFAPQDDLGGINVTKTKKRKGGDDGSSDLVIFGLIAAAAGFALMKLKKGGGKKKKKKKSKKA